MTKLLPTTRCWAEIDLEALRQNARMTQERVGATVKLLAVVKANAYGHGLAEVVRALQDEAQLFGVANLEEALEARAVTPHPIVILGPALPSERRAIVTGGFIATISSLAEAREFSRLAADSFVSVNFAIDTGMGRMGAEETSAAAVLGALADLPNVRLHSVSTHLPSADEDVIYTTGQLARFERLLQDARAGSGNAASYLVHVLPSAGVLNFSKSAYDIVRAGLMLYGASPNPQFQHLLRPVMALKTRVALVREIAAGASVSYGRTFLAPRAMRVATLSAGYADGIPRSISNREGAVLIGGRRCPLLGRVTMDLTMADVSEVPEVAPGDEAVLIGRQGDEEILAAEVAERAGTITWEVFTGIGSRAARVYL
ncbi:MAG: alanine racemase [Chthoniobacterales bacterium]